MIKKVLAASFWVSLGILLGRLLGFVREAVLAAKFGVSSNTDIAVLVLTIPDLLVNLLVAGGLSAALIPEFKSKKQSSSGALFVQVSLFVLVLFIIVTILLSQLSGWLVYLFAPGMDDSVSQVAQRTLRGVLWLIPLTVLAGVSTAFLQSQNRFAIPAMGTAIFNFSIVAGLIFFIDKSKGLAVLVMFIIAGGLVRWISQLWALRDNYSLVGNFNKVLLTGQLFHRYWQAVTALGILALYPIVFRSFASLQGDGELSVVNFAFRLVELPLGVVITVLAVVLFPRLSEYHEKNDQESFSFVLKEGLFWSVLFASSIAGVMAGGADLFTSIVYQWGEMTENEIEKVAMLVKILAFSLPFQAAIVMSISGFNARKITKMPLFLILTGLVALMPAVFVSIENAGVSGGGKAVVLSYSFVCLLFLFMLGRKYISTGFLALLGTIAVFVIILSYYLTNSSKLLFSDSNLAVITSAVLIVVIVPFIVSLLFPQYRQFLIALWPR